MAKQKAKVQGAPKKRDGEKIAANRLRPDQNERIREIALERGTSLAFIEREAVDWYLKAIDTAENHKEVIGEISKTVRNL